MNQGTTSRYIQRTTPTHRGDAYLALLVCAAIGFAARQFGFTAPGSQQDLEQAGLGINEVASSVEASAASIATSNRPAIESLPGAGAFSTDLLRALRMLQPARPIDPDTAIAAVRPLRGVRTVSWVAASTLQVSMEYEGERIRDAVVIEQVCQALQRLGDVRELQIRVGSTESRVGAPLAGSAWHCQSLEASKIVARSAP
ncbi:MAG: hypothetical protein ABI411_03915 [Tahibacter sp.]